MKRKKVRKPRRLMHNTRWLADIATDFLRDRVVVIHYASYDDPKEMRRLARWLDRAADYLASRGDKK